MMSWFKILVVVFIGILAVDTASYAQPKSSKKQDKKETAKTGKKETVKKSTSKSGSETVSKKEGTPSYQLVSFLPTLTFKMGTVGSYFYPVNVGSSWKLRTVSSLIGPDDKVVAADTAFHVETVTSNDTKSLQGYPLILCESRSFKPGRESEALVEQAQYYVDDSVIMSVFNHSLYHGETRAMLTAPLKVGTAWKERTEDTIYTVVASMEDTVVVPYGKFTNAISTVTTLGHGMLGKFFVPNVGVVKAVFRGSGPGGQGTLLVTTELIDLVRGTGTLPKLEMPGLNVGAPVEEKPAKK